mmetsp:Transcript_67850/g.75954  ORF Transcript_67850/g.75954 Transcript_67850/m.75954 type:complete len:416 (+) Transcript_67850:84-1331(+)
MAGTMKSKRSVALQPLSNNTKAVPTTPGKEVKKLKADLVKKDAENGALQDTIAELASALNCLNLVKTTAANSSISQSSTDKKGKKDKDAPVPNKTAYKYFCDNTPKQEGADMRLVYKEVAPEIRQVFTNLAEADKARFQRENAAYNEEKIALEMYKKKKKEDQAMAFYEAHLNAQAALEKIDADKKGKKAKKDPEAPKGSVSSYIYFTTDKRESVRKANADASPTQIMTILAGLWNKLEKGKNGKNGTKKYDDLATKDRARYETEKATYDAMIVERKAQVELENVEYLKQEKKEAMELLKTVRDANTAISTEVAKSSATMDDMSVISDITTTKTKKKKKDPNAPKGPTSSYLFFCNGNRAAIKLQMPEATYKELLTEVGRQWKDLTEKNKEKYTNMASLDKARYVKEMEKYNASK